MSSSGLIEQERYTCAIGAMQSVVAIPHAVPILHSGPGCGSMVLGFYERGTGYAGGYTAPCTNFSETEVVFGGADRLRTLIKGSYQILDSSLQVVLTGCTADIVGDDVASVVAEFVAEGKPLVHVETAGFKHNNYVAHSHVVNAIISQYVDGFVAGNAVRSNKKLVNVFASLPYQDPFWKGNLREYKRLLLGLGLEVNILFGSESGGVGEWQSIPSANFNILVSPWYGLPIVEHLRQQYEQPFYQFSYLPIGANETRRFLEGVLAFAREQGAGLDEARARTFIEREEQAFYEEIDNLATFLLEFRYGLPNHVHTIHDAGYVVGLAKFLLHEVGIVPKEQFIVDNTPPEHIESVRASLAATSNKRTIPVSFDPDAGGAQRVLRQLEHKGRGLIIGSGWDKELAQEKGYDFCLPLCPAPIAWC
jgi:nitrogenase molybdenum-iron protein beta chain